MKHKEMPKPTTYEPIEPLEPSVAQYERFIESGRLVPVGVRSSPLKYIADTWARRGYIWKEAQTKARTQNAQHKLGMWWSVLNPVASAAFYWLIFAVILGTDRGIANYTAYIIIGVLTFQYFATSFTSHATVMRSGRNMIKAFSFPRISVPLSLSVKNAMNHGPVLLVILVSIAVFPPHALPSLSWLLVVPIMALCFIFNLGIGLIIARYSYVFPDLGQILGVLTRFLLYGSGVIFPIERFINHPVVTEIVTANPIFQFLTLQRAVLIDGTAGDPMMWLWASCWSFGVLIVGFFIFWRNEEVFGRELN